MRYFFMLLLVLSCAGLTVAPASADETLTGAMASHNSLLGGAWNCITDVPAIMGMPATHERSRVTFDVAPGNVLHAAIVAADERADDYSGYSARLNNYWEVGASSHAIHSFGTSTDGTAFTGTSYLGAGSMDDSTTYAKINATQTTRREVLSRGEQTWTIDTSCTRAS